MGNTHKAMWHIHVTTDNSHVAIWIRHSHCYEWHSHGNETHVQTGNPHIARCKARNLSSDFTRRNLESFLHSNYIDAQELYFYFLHHSSLCKTTLCKVWWSPPGCTATGVVLTSGDGFLCHKKACFSKQTVLKIAVSRRSPSQCKKSKGFPAIRRYFCFFRLVVRNSVQFPWIQCKKYSSLRLTVSCSPRRKHAVFSVASFLVVGQFWLEFEFRNWTDKVVTALRANASQKLQNVGKAETHQGGSCPPPNKLLHFFRARMFHSLMLSWVSVGVQSWSGLDQLLCPPKQHNSRSKRNACKILQVGVLTFSHSANRAHFGRSCPHDQVLTFLHFVYLFVERYTRLFTLHTGTCFHPRPSQSLRVCLQVGPFN